MEEESGIYVGSGFPYDVLDSFTITPPMLRIIIWIWNCDDPYSDFTTKSFLKEEASAARMDIFSDNIDARHRHVVFAKPIPQGNRRTVYPISIHYS